ncbi:MAG: hypothetical protein ACKO96_28425, partial [Flammeovirgaceae bacterium]
DESQLPDHPRLSVIEDRSDLLMNACGTIGYLYAPWAASPCWLASKKTVRASNEKKKKGHIQYL